MQVKTKYLFGVAALLVIPGLLSPLFAQRTLTLKEAIQLGVDNYGTVKAKAEYAAASQAQVTEARRDYLPNVNLGLQADYGTVNAQYGGLCRATFGSPELECSFRGFVPDQRELGFLCLRQV